MHTNTIFRNKRSRIISTISLALTFFVCIATNSVAQQSTDKKIPLRLANSDSMKIPLKQILANPTLTAKEHDCEVTGFTVTFAPKGGNLHGPYKTKGNKLDENQVSYLKEFTNIKVTIIIEDIEVKCKDKSSADGAMIFTSLPE